MPGIINCIFYGGLEDIKRSEMSDMEWIIKNKEY